MSESRGYLYFLSYASKNRTYSSAEFDLFNKRLQNMVLEQAQIHNADAFIDREELELGDTWEPKLLEGLQTSRVLVSLFSTKYVLSPWCGLEFEFFNRRIDAWMRLNPGKPRPAGVLPVLWDVGTIVKENPALRALQHDTEGLPESYRSQGLKSLIMTRRDDVELNRVLLALRDRILNVAEGPAVFPRIAKPPAPKALGKPFGIMRERISNVEGHAPSESAGKRVGFVFAAAIQRDMSGADLSSWEGYGTVAFEWKPFYPNHPHNIGQIVQRVAADENILATWIDINEDAVVTAAALRSDIEAMTGDGNVVIAVVDPCSLVVGGINTAMSEMDKMAYGNVGIVIARNDSVPELSTSSDLLTKIFPNNIHSRRTKEYIDDIANAEALENCLSKLIVRLRAFVRNGPSFSDNPVQQHVGDQMPGI